MSYFNGISKAFAPQMVLPPHIELQWRALTVLLVKLFDEFLLLRRLRQRLDVCIKLC
jgi:hypothetical protein